MRRADDFCCDWRFNGYEVSFNLTITTAISVLKPAETLIPSSLSYGVSSGIWTVTIKPALSVTKGMYSSCSAFSINVKPENAKSFIRGTLYHFRFCKCNGVILWRRYVFGCII